MKTFFIVVLFTIIVTSLFYYLVEVLFRRSAGPDWDTIETKTIGTITRIDRGRNGGAWFSYMSDGKSYEEFDGLSINGVTLGEKYWIKYCSTCSNKLYSNIQSIDYLPLFTEDENYLVTKAKITRIFKFKWWGKGADTGIEFLYSVDGSNVKFERSQILPPNYKEKYSNIKVGQEYAARVWTLDYKRAIIDLDTPIK